MLRFWSTVIAIGIAAATVRSPEPSTVILGLVLDSASQAPIYPSRVDVVGMPLLALGDSFGRFVLSNVPRGRQRLLARGMLHFPESLTVQLDADTVRLQPIRLRLDVRMDSFLRSLQVVAPSRDQ
jgi:hypothetical protein